MTNLAAVQPNDSAWLKGAFRDLGLHEISGPRHSARVLEMFKVSGHPEIRDDETAWCSAAVNAWMIEAGYPGTRALNARSWLTYGQALGTKKTLPRGAVLIFRRGNSSWQGHVCLLLEDRGGTLMVIGGNQSDQVCVRVMSRDNLIGACVPTTVTNSRTVQAFAGAGAVEGVGEAVAAGADSVHTGVDKITETLGLVKVQFAQAAEYVHFAQTGLKVIATILFCFGMYRLIRSHIWVRKDPVALDDFEEEPAPPPETKRQAQRKAQRRARRTTRRRA